MGLINACRGKVNNNDRLLVSDILSRGEDGRRFFVVGLTQRLSRAAPGRPSESPSPPSKNEENCQAWVDAPRMTGTRVGQRSTVRGRVAGSRKTRAGGRRHFDEVANEATAAEQGNTTMAQRGMATRGEPLRGQASGRFLWQHRPVICHSSACPSHFPLWQGQGAVRERVESTPTDRPIPVLGRSSRRPVPPSQSHGICPPTLNPWHHPSWTA